MENLYFVTAQFEGKEQIEYPIYADAPQTAADILTDKLSGIPHDIVRVTQRCTNWH